MASASCNADCAVGGYSPYVTLSISTSGGSASNNICTVSYTLSYYTRGSTVVTNGVGRFYTINIDGQVITGSYDINGKSSGTIRTGSVTVARASNGGARSISCSVSFTFDINWSGTYVGTRSGSCSVNTTSIIRTFTVSFNANGGSGAPSTQTKTYGVTLTLSSTKPTRAGYIFKGWGTSKTDTTATYQPGGSYTSNSNITLYAIWTIAELIKFTLGTAPSITVPSTGSDCVGSPPAASIAATVVYTNNNINTNFYYRIGYCSDINGNVGSYSGQADSIKGPYKASSTKSLTISIPANIVKQAIINCKSDTQCKFFLQVSSIDNNFTGAQTNNYIITASLVNFNVLRFESYTLYRDSSGKVTGTIELKIPKSYIVSTSAYPKIKVEIDDSGTVQLTGATVKSIGTDKLTVYNFIATTTLIDSNAHKLELTATDGLFTAKLITRIAKTGDDKIRLFSTGKLQAIEFIESDTKFGFEKGGRVYAKEFIETEDGIAIKNESGAVFYIKELEER